MVDAHDDPSSVLITGASGGIGRALAEAYAGPGRRLALWGRDGGRLADAAEACRALGAMVRIDAVDVTDRARMVGWIADVDAEQPLDLVIANAGIAEFGPGADDERVHDVFAVNLAGVLNTVLPVIPRMKARGHGQIAIMSSLAGFRGLASAPAYSASKAAVRAYGEALRGVLAPHGIGVSVIMPGFVESRITDANTFPMPFLMPADKAARLIKRGLALNRPRIAFPFPAHAAMWLMSALPPRLVDPLLNRIPRKG